MKMKFVVGVLIFSAFLTACGGVTKQTPGAPTSAIKSEDQLFREAENSYEQGKYQDAIHLYSEYIDRFPNGSMADAAFLKLAMTYGQIGKNDKALDLMSQLSMKFPNSPLIVDAQIETLGIYLAQGRFSELEQNASKILGDSLENSQRMRLYGILGDRYVAGGDLLKAIKYYDQMLQLSSGRSRMVSFDKIQSAVDHLDADQIQRMLKESSDKGIRSHLLFRLGNIYYTEKKIGDAERIFKELLEKYPEFREKNKITEILDAIASGEIFAPYTLGCLLPLSGSYAAYGQRALQGIEMALIHFSRLVPDLMPKLVVKDTKSDPKQANKALTEMAKEGVAAIIGPMVTAEQVAMTADALGVPIITLTQKDYITDSGPYVFRNFITPEMQVKALVNYATESLGSKRFAILYPKENYGVTFMDLFWDEVVVYNGSVVGVESYHTSQTDFADAIKQIVGLYYPMSKEKRKQALAHAEMLRNPDEALQFLTLGQPLISPSDMEIMETESELESNNADMEAEAEDSEDSEELESIVDFHAVFIPDSPKKVGLIVPQLAYYDIRDVCLLGTNIWHSDNLIRMSGKYLSDAVVVDGFFAESNDPHIREFVYNFKDTYNEEPEIISATAYDSALIILNFLKDPAITQRSHIKNRLLSMRPYDGITGKTSFRTNGDVSKNLFILGVRSGRFVELGRLNPYPADIQLSSEKAQRTPKDTFEGNR